MFKGIKKIVSFALAVTMLTIPVFAIIPPEDAVPAISDRELIKEKVNELMRVRMQKGKIGITQDEIGCLESLENNIISEIEGLGATKMNAQEVAQAFGQLPNIDETSPNFEGLGHTDINSYFIYGPYSTVYNGRTMYYMDVLVAPCGRGSYLWRDTLDRFYPDVSGTYGSYKNTVITSSPSGVWGTPAHAFVGQGVSDSEDGEYSIGVELATCVDYIYIGTRNSSDVTDYALGLISTLIETYETHRIDNDDDFYTVEHNGDLYNTIEYYNYGDVDYAFECYFSGRGFDIVCPMDISYYFGGRYLGSGQVIQPYSSPYMYE